MRARQLQDLFRPHLSTEAEEELQALRSQLNNTSLLQGTKDEIIWRWKAAGTFTVKSAYRAMKGGPTIQTRISRIWSLKAPPRFKVFGWLMMLNKLLTIDNLIRRGWQLVNRCILCKSNSETVHHLFMECAFTKVLCNKAAASMQIRVPTGGTTNLAANFITDDTYTQQERSTLLIIQFVIWRERCSRIFRERDKTIDQLLEEVSDQRRITMASTYH